MQYSTVHAVFHCPRAFVICSTVFLQSELRFHAIRRSIIHFKARSRCNKSAQKRFRFFLLNLYSCWSRRADDIRPIYRSIVSSLFTATVAATCNIVHLRLQQREMQMKCLRRCVFHTVNHVVKHHLNEFGKYIM